MSDRLKALRERRGKIVADMKALTDKATAEKRDMTDEETAQHEKLFGEQDKVRGQIAAEERQVELDREMAASAAKDEEERKKAGGEGGGNADDLAAKAWRKWLQSPRSLTDAEHRALNAGADNEGGYLKPPPQFIASLLKAVDNMVFIRQAATKYQVNASNSLGVPTLETDQDDFGWTSELATGSEDTATRFGKRELSPHPMAKRIKISKTLMRAGALPIEQIVQQRMAYKIGITQEKAYLTGTGANQPLGVLTASNNGISTGRDVSTGNTSTSITFDGLMSAKYALKSQYWPRAQWLFHRDAVLQIAKLKDGQGQYLWRESVRAGEPDQILGRPLMVSEYVSNTFTTGLYVGMFADFSFYWIADSLDFQVQRLVELYAETNQDGMIARYEGDGMPVLEEAFVRVKLG